MNRNFSFLYSMVYSWLNLIDAIVSVLTLGKVIDIGLTWKFVRWAELREADKNPRSIHIPTNLENYDDEDDEIPF